MPSEYAFDLKLKASIRVKADSFAEARRLVNEHLDAADSNFGSWPDGSPILGEASLISVVTKDMLFEVDGEPATVCPSCSAIEGEPEWGTVGDGFDGYCPSCADRRRSNGEVEIG